MNRSKISLIVIIVALAATVLGPSYAQETYTVGITSLFGHEPLFAEMAALGYVEGENITYLTIVFDPTMAPEDFPAYYNERLQIILDANVDVLVTTTDTEAMNLPDSVGDTPIVFVLSDDPVATGAVADLVSPGGNMTGIITNRPHERRLQVLTEIRPDTDKVYYLYSTLTGEAETVLQQVQTVAAELGVEVITATTNDVPSALEALANVPEGVDWFFLTPYVPFDFAFYAQLTVASEAHKVGIAGVTDIPSQDTVVGYGPNVDAASQQAARIVDRILRGANPADLPIQTAENYLSINLEAAAAIDLEIPVGILRQANLILRPGDFDENGMYIAN